jgi:hypothetical protein
MAALDEMSNPILDELEKDWKLIVGKMFWEWFDSHSHDVILEWKRLLIFDFTLEVKDLKGIFEQLFGPHP